MQGKMKELQEAVNPYLRKKNLVFFKNCKWLVIKSMLYDYEIAIESPFREIYSVLLY